MGESEHLSTGEFQRSMKSLLETVEGGFERTDRRLEAIAEAQTEHAERLAVLESASRTRTKRATGWGAAIASVVVGAAETIRYLLK